MSRRKFLKSSISTAVALNAPWILTSCRKDEEPLPVPQSSGEITARVSAVRGSDLDAMTRDAIDALGGMQAIVNKGDSVFIKPNFVSFPWAKTSNCFLSGECTKPEIIIATAEECLRAGAAGVTVGEGSHLPKFDWQYATTLDGTTNLVREAARLSSLYSGKVSLACLETDSPEWIEIPSVTPLNKIAVSSLVAKADKVITIPVAKTHSWAQVTLAAKNFIGITPLSRYAQLVDNTWWNRGTFDHRSPRAIGQVYLDIVKSIRPDLSIVDFSICLEADGPSVGQGGRTLDVRDRLGTWAVIASRDIMAADATAARMMSHDTDQVRHLAMGFHMGLGEVRERSIEMLGEKAGNMQMRWKPARLKG